VNDRAAYANADARFLPLPDKSVHMIATSPPYWGLRSYATGDNKHAELGTEAVHDCLAWARHEEPCSACYVCNLREWAAEMWRVLRDDGVMFLNLGDSYANGNAGSVGSSSKSTLTTASRNGAWAPGNVIQTITGKNIPPGLKPKDLVGIPWRVALALQADGWYLRSDIIWAKPNPMPESVTDRPTKAHEYIFLLTKSARYFWDGEAVREAYAMSSWTAESDKAGTTKRGKAGIRSGDKGNARANGAADGTRYGETSFMNAYHQSGRNIRTVWNVATQPYSGAHFATWPPALVERMVKAGTSERGVCPVCGAPWRRVVEKGAAVNAPRNPNDVRPYDAASGYNNGNGATTLHKVREVKTVEWRPTCAHADAAPVPAIVLDPFCGSGTTLLVARQLGRIGLGFDLSETYLRQNAATRLGHDRLAAWGRGIQDTTDYSDLFRTNGNSNGVTP
jgi:DNA modification methylase